MPDELDLYGQIKKAYPNMGFDSMAQDIERGEIELVGFSKQGEVSQIFWDILRQNKNIREWLQHLFRLDFPIVSNGTVNGIDWKYEFSSLHFKSDTSIFGDLNVEERDRVSVVTLKSPTFNGLYDVTRQKIGQLLQIQDPPSK